MNIDMKKLQKALAEHKAYNAWPYISSLQEMLEYLAVSNELLQKVYNHRLQEIDNLNAELFHNAHSNPGTFVPLTTEHLKRTNLNIVGYEINDTVFLRKTIIEVMHYARVCMDLLVQITNAALFGDNAVDVEDRRIAKKVSRKLSKASCFLTLKTIFDCILSDADYQYLTAFDNYLKHIKTILISVNNGILLDNHGEFVLDSFVFHGVRYPSRDAISAATSIYQMVVDNTDKVLSEILVQIPNGKKAANRIHTLQFDLFAKKSPESKIVESISFFINVEKDLSELPREIAVRPLIIQPSGEVCEFDLQLEEIFIRRMHDDGSFDILGCARLKNGLDTNEFYRRYIVSPCDSSAYTYYLINFATKYPHVSLNTRAISGRLILA